MKKFALVTLVLACTGCASAVNKHQVLQHQLDMPIDCEMAEVQITKLEQEKVSGGEQLVNGLATVLPTSIVLNLLAGEYTSRWKLANGDFNDKLYMRIADIEEECSKKSLVANNNPSETAS